MCQLYFTKAETGKQRFLCWKVLFQLQTQPGEYVGKIAQDPDAGYGEQPAIQPFTSEVNLKCRL